jgi:hypothetical protein
VFEILEILYNDLDMDKKELDEAFELLKVLCEKLQDKYKMLVIE